MHVSNLISFQAVLVMLLLITQEATSSKYQPRRVEFGRCTKDEPMPRAMFITCANKKGTACEVRMGGVHKVQVVFVPEYNSTDVDSRIAWNNDWLEVEMPNQNRNPCDGMMECPLEEQHITRFDYSLKIESFWIRGVYPVIWRLTDRMTNKPVVCLKFKMEVV
ncbi:unnamed protein product [Meganyctiphanes norvegica]|uniref:MD-2-related lipid-recognition domain-containing protein n=1 Tax=Meganyctiphanes norvegica TaxID=48144 RepID=A0AAV2QMJ2_MEGNR